MSHSVRRALVDWLQRIVDHLSEKPMKGLRRPDIQAQPGGNGSYPVVIGVDYGRSERQVEYAVMLTGLGKQVDILNRHPVVSDLPPLGAHSQLASRFNNNFVLGHPLGSSLNLKNMNIPQQGAVYNQDVARLNEMQARYHRGLSRKESSGGDK